MFTEQPCLLRCWGDEDRSTQSLRRPALSRALTAAGDLIVDMRELSFADTSLMIDLVMIARRLRRTGRTMRITGAGPHTHSLLELVGLHRLPGVHVEGPVAPALA